ncbi:hypothetical protein DKT77_18420 [Meridianimarinicoccus roseus]|jgi:hypothetical protein|uniref:Anti-sigma factor NepR domain-containing protein n=1 Tax=Meridianimarinicoccus roseus TaxID=2072018 RepID=A0A2V2LCY8_9RHOB|nr:hypothetical protein [Meridianimarinicoccus roseus]PWR01136.1 hypothetical protein DKT77_18420 [Meridianimarinicoccus roseus]
MHDADETPGGGARRSSATLEAQIDENLRLLFETDLAADLPPKLAALVARLDAGAGDGCGSGPDTPPDAGSGDAGPDDGDSGGTDGTGRVQFFSHWRLAI